MPLTLAEACDGESRKAGLLGWQDACVSWGLCLWSPCSGRDPRTRPSLRSTVVFVLMCLGGPRGALALVLKSESESRLCRLTRGNTQLRP